MSEHVEVHVDTPEQAVARQQVETCGRVTHVAVSEAELEEAPPSEGGEEYSLAVLVKPVVVKKPAKHSQSSSAEHTPASSKAASTKDKY